ncbi:MAG: CAP domain-containing protein, partial [Acinetobacter sp.]
MNQCNLFCSLLGFILLSACNTSAPTATPQENATSVAQIQIETTEIRCQDLQNPAYRQVIINTINEIRQHPRQCGQQHFSA